MKKIFIIALALVSFTINAQDKRENRLADKKEKLSKMNAEDMADHKTKKMVKHLGLTEAQEQQVYALNLENAKGRIAMKTKRLEARTNNEKPSKEAHLARKNARQEHMEATKSKMQSILTEEQFEKLNKHLEKRKNKRAEKRGEKKQKKGKRHHSCKGDH